MVAGIFLNEGVFGSLGSCPRVLKGSRGFVTRVINNPTYVPPIKVLKNVLQASILKQALRVTGSRFAVFYKRVSFKHCKCMT